MSNFGKSKTLLEKPVFFQPSEHNALNPILQMNHFVMITFFGFETESKQGRKEMIPNDTKFPSKSFRFLPTNFCYGLWSRVFLNKNTFGTTEGNDTKWYHCFLPNQYLQHNDIKTNYVIYHRSTVCSKLKYFLCLNNKNREMTILFKPLYYKMIQFHLQTSQPSKCLQET